METKKILNEKILTITMFIKNKYPELSGFLDEMPVTIPDEEDPTMNLVILKEYYESLLLLLKKYSIEHPIYSLKHR